MLFAIRFFSPFSKLLGFIEDRSSRQLFIDQLQGRRSIILCITSFGIFSHASPKHYNQLVQCKTGAIKNCSVSFEWTFSNRFVSQTALNTNSRHTHLCISVVHLIGLDGLATGLATMINHNIELCPGPELPLPIGNCREWSDDKEGSLNALHVHLKKECNWLDGLS